IEALSGAAEVIRVSKPYKLASRDVKEEDTVIRFPSTGIGPDATIGGRDLAVIAGPCSIESRDQAFAIAENVAASGAQFFRGGAYKPRTSPYAHQGGNPRPLRPAHRYRSHRQREPGTGGRMGRCGPDRRPQHAELFPAQACRQVAGADRSEEHTSELQSLTNL